MFHFVTPILHDDEPVYVPPTGYPPNLLSNIALQTMNMPVVVALFRAARHIVQLAAQVGPVYVSHFVGTSHILICWPQKEASHSLRPLTVSQVLKATQAHADADWAVDDAEIGQVSCLLLLANMFSILQFLDYYRRPGRNCPVPNYQLCLLDR